MGNLIDVFLKDDLLRPVQLSQHGCSATIRLDPVACFHRDRRRCHDDAVVPHLDELPMNVLPALGLFAFPEARQLAIRRDSRTQNAVKDTADLVNLQRDHGV